MLNLADFSMLLMVLIGPVSAAGAAHAHKASVLAIVLFGLSGLALGAVLSMVANKCAYRVLHSKRLPTGLSLGAYAAIPFLGILIVVVVPYLVAEIVYGHT